MADTNEEIKKYSIEYFADGNVVFAERPEIKLMRSDNSLFAILYFYRDPTAMPNSDEDANANRPYAYCYFPEHHFKPILDILRNEKPIRFRYVSNLKIGIIESAVERVGEGE